MNRLVAALLFFLFAAISSLAASPGSAEDTAEVGKQVSEAELSIAAGECKEIGVTLRGL